MRALLTVMVLAFSLVALPLSLYQGYLLYSHVQATELMWFLWWVNLPLTIIVSVFSSIIGHLLKKD